MTLQVTGNGEISRCARLHSHHSVSIFDSIEIHGQQPPFGIVKANDPLTATSLES